MMPNPRRIALVVEGHGDVAAVPCIVRRVAHHVGRVAYPLLPAIRAGGLPRLLKAGELEKRLIQAASRDDADFVLVVLDCDDGCPASLSDALAARAQPISERFGKEIRFCLIVREYESWFLAVIESLVAVSPETWAVDEDCGNYLQTRGAKERLSRYMVGRQYKETRDQEFLSRHIDIDSLALKDRSFQKLVKCVST